MMASVFEKYVWLVDTLRRSGPMTLDELSRAWSRSSRNDDGEPLNERTFYRHRRQIADRFGIEIKCDRSGFTYYIEDEGEDAGVQQWLLSCITVENMLGESRDLRERILFENIPSGQRYLSGIIAAMRDGRALEMSYSPFRDVPPYSTWIHPYFIKVFNQRWYIGGPTGTHPDEVRIYALDRVQSLRELRDSFVYPRDFSPAGFFADSYGIFHGDEPPCIIVLRAGERQARYLRSLPLHPTQAELSGEQAASLGYEVGEGMHYFRLRLVPTFDFVQYLLSQGADLEVVSPQSLREQLREKFAAAEKLYR